MPPSYHGQRLLDLTGEGVLADGPGADQGAPRFLALPNWAKTDDRGRVKFIREITRDYGMDPRMRWYTARMLRRDGVVARDYPRMARSILKHVQTNIYYTQEAGEQLQSPWRTLDARTGDCDDMALLVGAMAESVGLPWKMALGGVDKKGRLARWVDGTRWKPGVYSHIYPLLAWPPGRPTHWVAAEPTMQVPLGYDVTIHGMDFDEHGRPSARPVTLDKDGIAMLPGGSPNLHGRGAAGQQAFSGSLGIMSPTTAGWLPWLAAGAAVLWYWKKS
jgi:hypothetical protein